MFSSRHTHKSQAVTNDCPFSAVAVAVFWVMMVSLWGGSHVSDAWYKRSEDENADGILKGQSCVGVWVGEGGAVSHLS